MIKEYEVYNTYELASKTREQRRQAMPGPTRSHISGARADNFGDVIFVDHAVIDAGRNKYLILLVPDGATHSLSAYIQPSLRMQDTLTALGEWTDSRHCKPKSLVADMAFHSEQYAEFFAYNGIKAYPTGARTP